MSSTLVLFNVLSSKINNTMAKLLFGSNRINGSISLKRLLMDYVLSVSLDWLIHWSGLIRKVTLPTRLRNLAWTVNWFEAFHSTLSHRSTVTCWWRTTTSSSWIVGNQRLFFDTRQRLRYKNSTALIQSNSDKTRSRPVIAEIALK